MPTARNSNSRNRSRRTTSTYNNSYPNHRSHHPIKLDSYTNSKSQSSTINKMTNNNNNNSYSLQAQANDSSNQTMDSISGSSVSSSAGSSPSSLAARSNANYDRIRNETLMFFLDRLISDPGTGGRSLHDLSCLFGSREFTKEMRQIVGASRNGLRKFLQSFPSLFTIEGDLVHLTSLDRPAAPSSGATSNGVAGGTMASGGLRSGLGARDYQREAVDYFASKLAEFGHSQVPIRYLFGYRSQASQEVRHVSGRTAPEFQQFLADHPEAFELAGEEHVWLKGTQVASNDDSHSDNPNNNNNDDSEQPNSLVSLEQRLAQSSVSMDPYLNKRLAQLIEAKMREDNLEQISFSQLHKRMSCEPLYTNQIKSIDDLRMLLRMHPKMFSKPAQVGSHMQPTQDSTTTPTPKPSDDEQEFVVSLLSRVDEPTFGLIDDKPPVATPVTESNAPSQLDKMSLNKQPESEKNHNQAMSLPQVSSSVPNHDNDTTKQQRQCDVIRQPKPQRPFKSALRAEAAPFVPASFHSLRRSVSSVGANSQHPQPHLANEARQSLRSYLIKASASNQANFSPAKQSNGSSDGDTKQEYNSSPPQTHNQTQPIAAQESQSLKARWINIVREASSIVSRIMATTDAIALDCKGFNLGLNGEISLVQIAFLPEPTSSKNNHNQNVIPKPDVCLFDLKTNSELAYLLKPLLESEQIVKIIHDVRNKSNALYNQFDIMLNNVFDTQVANLVIQQQETAKPAYKSRYISINKLCEIYGNESLNRYRNLIKSRTRHGIGGGSVSSTSQLTRSHSSLSSSHHHHQKSDANFWLARPLTDSMVYELTMDVYCLIGGVYQTLKSTLKAEYEPLFQQLNRECVLARIKPDEIRSVKKERKIDLEVIDLKRKLYAETGEKLVLSNREIRLLRHVDLSAGVRAKIGHCKKVAKKLERLDMKAAKLAQLQAGGREDSSGSSSTRRRRQTGEESGDENSHDEPDESEQDDEYGEQMSCLNTRQPELDTLATMMDELKDKMIQDTSSLLGSFDEEEDEAELAAAVTGIQPPVAAANPTHISIHSANNNNNNNNDSSLSTSSTSSSTSNHRHSSCCNCNCHHHSSANSQTGTPAPSSERGAGHQDHRSSASMTNEQTNTTTTTTTNTTHDNDNHPTLQTTAKSCNEFSNMQTASSIDTSDLLNCDQESPSGSLVDTAIQCDLTAAN